MKKLYIIITLALLSASCNPLSTSLPDGVIKSVNGGADWQFANAVKGSTSTSLASLSISKLDFDPQNNQTVFAASYTDGLFKSDDSAADWSKILSKILVFDFSINPTDSKTIYAAGSYADHGLVLKTTDGGGSWNQVYDEESVNNPVRTIALNPANPNEIVIGTNSGSLIKSSDGGDTWQLVKDFGDRINKVFWQNGNVYMLLKTRGLFESTDSAASFTEISAGLNKSFNFGTLSYTSDTAVSSFNEAYIDFTTPDLIYMTTDKGLYKTTDNGKTWTLQNLPIQPDVANAYAIAISKTSSNIVYTSVGSTMYKSTDGGQTWQTQSVASGGFIVNVLVDPVLPQIVYGGIYSTQ